MIARYREALVADTVVADETGEIILNLWRGRTSYIIGIEKYVLRTVQRPDRAGCRKKRIIVLRDM